MAMKIVASVMEAMLEHAGREYPVEACGYLAGAGGIITRHYELRNMDGAADHFAMDPGEQFAAIKDMRGRGLKPAAVYHSHPETPARPSVEDIRLAYDPDISYVIVSLAGQDPVIKSFRIRQGSVAEEVIEAVNRKHNELPSGSFCMEKNMKSTIKADSSRNCAGVGCPMNLVYAKLELAKLASGQVLEIILDDGAPVNNVPISAEREGHVVLERNLLENGTWSVLIRKA